jgi:hypothetical protein
VSNLRDGMDLYKTGWSTPVQSYRQGLVEELDKNYPFEVSFLHGGKAVVCGSSSGNIGIWDTSTGEQLQCLPHGGESAGFSDSSHVNPLHPDAMIQSVCVRHKLSELVDLS